MKASDNFKIQGYLQLFMAFWPKGHPDVKFYMAMNFDFTKPVTEDVLKTFLEASGKLCEEQNPGIEFEGEYITKSEYETDSADDSKFDRHVARFGDVKELPESKF
jgi:hypothetical protein